MRWVFLVLTLLLSCSNLSKNLVRKGHLKIAGGRYIDQKWSESLKFEHVSWYQSMTLVYDVLYAKLSPKMPFYNWLSPGERESLSRCHDHYIVLSYEFSPKRVSNGMFMEMVRKAGYEKMGLSNFSRHLEMHPDFQSLSLALYKIYGLCRGPSETGEYPPIDVHFPGFKRIFIP